MSVFDILEIKNTEHGVHTTRSWTNTLTAWNQNIQTTTLPFVITILLYFIGEIHSLIMNHKFTSTTNQT